MTQFTYVFHYWSTNHIFSVFIFWKSIFRVENLKTVTVWLMLKYRILKQKQSVIKVWHMSANRYVVYIFLLARSPVFSHLSSSIQGLSTIRAFKVQQRFQQMFDEYQDLHSGENNISVKDVNVMWYPFKATIMLNCLISTIFRGIV